jgi:hypothetical protein
MKGAWRKGSALAAGLLWSAAAWGEVAKAPSAVEVSGERFECRCPSQRASAPCVPSAKDCPFGAEQLAVPQQIQIFESSTGTLRNSDPAGCWMPGQSLDVTHSTNYDAPG